MHSFRCDLIILKADLESYESYSLSQASRSSKDHILKLQNNKNKIWGRIVKFWFLKIGLALANAYLSVLVICYTHSKHILIALCSISNPSQEYEDFEIRHFGEFEYEYSGTVWKFWKFQDRRIQYSLYLMDLQNSWTDISMDSMILYDNMWVSVSPNISYSHSAFIV